MPPFQRTAQDLLLYHEDHKLPIKICIVRIVLEVPLQFPTGRSQSQPAPQPDDHNPPRTRTGRPQSPHQDMYTSERPWTPTPIPNRTTNYTSRHCKLRKVLEVQPQYRTTTKYTSRHVYYGKYLNRYPTGRPRSTHQDMYTSERPWTTTPIPNRTITKHISRHVYNGKSLKSNPDPQPDDHKIQI